MKKNIKLLLLFLVIFFSTFFIFQSDIKADYSGTGGTGSGSVSGIGNEGSWNTKFGIFIKVYRQNNTQRGNTVDIYFGGPGNMTGDLSGWISGSNGSYSSNPDRLYNYLDIPYESVSGDYSTLLSKINTTLNIGDYITIEPYTMIGSKKYTFRDISDSTEKYNKCTEMKCTKYKCATYKCAQYQNTTCKTYSNTCKRQTCSAYKCKKWNTKCVKRNWLGICKKSEKTTCKTYSDTCQTYKCAEYQCAAYNKTCKTYSTTECATTSSECQTRSTTECGKTTSYSYPVWYAKPAVILSNAAKVGSNITVGSKTFTAPTSSCTTSSYGSSKYCGYSSNKNIGYGITVVRYEDIYKNGTLKISIKRNDNKQLIKTRDATFRIYNSSGTRIKDLTTRLGVVEYTLQAGTYKVEEISSPHNYLLASSKSVNVNIAANQVTPVDFLYNTTCAVDLEEMSSKTPQNLMNLYKKYPNNTNLLNFSNPSCSKANCNETTLNNSLSCLSGEATLSSTFNENNLSCYDGDPITDIYGNYIGFCSDYFNLTNNLGTNKFYGISGQFLIRQGNNVLTIYNENLEKENINNQYVATSRSGKVCYVLSGNRYDISSNMKSSSVYFGDVDEDSQADLLDSDAIISANTTNNLSTFTKYTYELMYNYKLSKPIYLEKITGKYSSTKTNNTSQEGIYGILSKFNSSNGYIPFSINYNNNVYTSDKCEYETKKEIIKYDGNQNGNIELEFRTIDTNNPFSNRDAKTNFCDETGNCSKNNNRVQESILNRNNSYNKTSEGPMYKIILTPSDIKTIRKYNDNYSYDEYLKTEVNYSGEQITRNSFLYNIETGNLGGDALSNALYNKKYDD